MTTGAKHPPPVKTITWAWNTSREEDLRNWLELPPEVILRIFMKLETVDVLLTVSQVCSSWRHLSKDPILYRSVVFGMYGSIFPRMGYAKLARKAVDRSCGRLVQFSCGNMRNFYMEDLNYIVDSCTSLRSLRLGFLFHIEFNDVVKILKKIPTLEDLCIDGSYNPRGMFEGIGCLKYLQFGVVPIQADVTALEIAERLPYLRTLRFLANGLTNNGLRAILDGCPHLEYVYLKGFSNLDAELLKKKYCDRIKSMTVLHTENDIFGEELEFHLKDTTRRSW